MLEISQLQKELLQKKILSWYSEHQRDLPWRKTHDPYLIFISECMLQQTQVIRVIEKYKEWQKSYPTVIDLAKANPRDVLALWSGLGYNRRALNILKTAKIITADFDGAFPDNEKELLKLPGIGMYTARAILCFAFQKQVSVIDTNVKKIIALEFFNGIVPSMQELEHIARELLPEGKAYDWNQALMDYAAVNLKKEKIRIPKQSRFKGSNRYFRGQIIRLLTRYESLTLEEIEEKVLEKVDINLLQNILHQLMKEQFITMEQGKYRI